MRKSFKELYVEKNNNEEGFIYSNNYKIVDLNDDFCKMEANVTNSSLNPFGIAHGGYIFGLADTCAGVLANTQGKDAVTISSSINYLSKADTNKLIAEARIIKKGKKLIACDCDIYNDKNKIIAKAILEYYLMTYE